jgi:glutamate transport system substrate-binding protein
VPGSSGIIQHFERKQARMRIFRNTAIAGMAIAALALSACAGDASQKQEEKDQLQEEVGDYSMEKATDIPDGLIKDIQDKGQLVVGAKFDQPLIGQKNAASGKIEGFDAEIARLLTMRIFGEVKEDGDKPNLKFVETTSENRETYVEDGTVDVVIASYSMYPERLTSFDFAGPYFDTGQNALVKTDNKDIETIDDLSGKKVCIAEGSGSIENLEKENPKAEITTLKDYAACAESVENGTHDAVSTDETILYGFVSTKGDKFKVLDSKNNFTEEPYGIGMKLGETDARMFMNDMLEEAMSNGDWDKAFDLTFGAAGMPKPEHPKVDRYEAK